MAAGSGKTNAVWIAGRMFARAGAPWHAASAAALHAVATARRFRHSTALRRAPGLIGALATVVLLPAPMASAQETRGSSEAAREKISTCTGCHGIKGYRASFPSVYSVPRIAGQTEKYLTNALIAYRKGDRDHPTMRAVAGGLSDQDIADLAAFYAQSN